MKRSRALVNHRREKLLSVVEKNGVVKVEDLAQTFSVSPLTIRRDLQYLENEGKLDRFYGGAMVPETSKGKNREREENAGCRERIARYAAGLVEDGDTIFINSSSTALQMMKYIRKKQVTVITNNGKAIYMEHSSNVRVVLTGGELREVKEAMVGEFAVNNLSRVLAKKSFVGCSGLSLECGMTTEILNEVNINELMCTRVTGDVYILADHTKFGRNSSFVSCPLEKITHVITDEKAPKAIVDELQNRGIQVKQVGWEER